MAVLSDTDRARVWRGLMRYWSRLETRQDLALTKADLRAAIDAADAWIDAAATSYNSALPATARAGLTPGQKAFLLAAIVLIRIEPGLLRAILGEVD
jgi:hypothetical protein